ncbi:MAG: nitrate reductase [Proteobacteria bacterium]|nr:nitrate reductase [Pseudomonadota bacterium]
MNLLEFVRGPAFWFSLFVLVAGSVWRVIGIYRLGNKPDLSEPRSTRWLSGALHGILWRMTPRKEFRGNVKLGVINGYIYHIGLAAIAFGYLPHILFIKRLTGLAWSPLPELLFYFAAGFTGIALLTVLLERITDPVMRLLSGFDDYFSWFVVFLPLLTGMGAMTGWASQTSQSDARIYQGPLAIHLLSVELLFLWLPFGKLGHAFLVFFSRTITGIALERKGAAL